MTGWEQPGLSGQENNVFVSLFAVLVLLLLFSLFSFLGPGSHMVQAVLELTTSPTLT